MAPRHLANEIDGKVVDALMTATERHHATVQRYYRLKGKLLGLEQLRDYDRYAPLFSDQPAVDWPTARQIVEDELRGVQPPGGRDHSPVLRSLVDRRGIAPRQARRGVLGQHRAQRPSLHPDELHGQAARRDDAGPRTGPRIASVPVAQGRLFAVRHALDHGRDGERLRRDAHLPPVAATVSPSRASAWRCCAARSRTASPRSSARWC